MEELILENDEYRLFMHENMLEVYRFGKPWRRFVLVGKMVSLFEECLRLARKGQIAEDNWDAE